MGQRDLQQKVVGFITQLEQMIPLSSGERNWLRGAVLELREMNVYEVDPNKEIRVVQEVIESCAKSARNKRVAERFNSLYHQLSDIRLETLSLQNSLQKEQY